MGARLFDEGTIHWMWGVGSVCRADNTFVKGFFDVQKRKKKT